MNMENRYQYYQNEYHAINSIKKRIGRSLTEFEQAHIFLTYAKEERRGGLPIYRGWFDGIFPELKDEVQIDD